MNELTQKCTLVDKLFTLIITQEKLEKVFFSE